MELCTLSCLNPIDYNVWGELLNFTHCWQFPHLKKTGEPWPCAECRRCFPHPQHLPVFKIHFSETSWTASSSPDPVLSPALRAARTLPCIFFFFYFSTSPAIPQRSIPNTAAHKWHLTWVFSVAQCPSQATDQQDYIKAKAATAGSPLAPDKQTVCLEGLHNWWIRAWGTVGTTTVRPVVVSAILSLAMREEAAPLGNKVKRSFIESFSTAWGNRN